MEVSTDGHVHNSTSCVFRRIIICTVIQKSTAMLEVFCFFLQNTMKQGSMQTLSPLAIDLFYNIFKFKGSCETSRKQTNKTKTSKACLKAMIYSFRTPPAPKNPRRPSRPNLFNLMNIFLIFVPAIIYVFFLYPLESCYIMLSLHWILESLSLRKPHLTPVHCPRIGRGRWEEAELEEENEKMLFSSGSRRHSIFLPLGTQGMES